MLWNQAPKLSAHLCSSAKGLRCIWQQRHGYRVPAIRSALALPVLGCVGMAHGTHVCPGSWLWHHVYTTYHIMGPPFLLVSLSRFDPSRGWKESRLNIPNKTEDNGEPKVTNEKFLGSRRHNVSVISFPLLTQSVQNPFISSLKL